MTEEQKGEFIPPPWWVETMGGTPAEVELAERLTTTRAEDERDELRRQLEEARRLACHYADLLHLAHDSVGIIERDWKAS